VQQKWQSTCQATLKEEKKYRAPFMGLKKAAPRQEQAKFVE